MLFPSGFYDMAPSKRQRGKKASCRLWRLEDLVLTKVKGFSAWLAKVCQSIFHSHLFSLFYVCDVCCCCYLHLPHQIIYFLCPDVLGCHPRVCVNVYRFSWGFISITQITMAIEIFFDCPICADIFFLILELQNLVL